MLSLYVQSTDAVETELELDPEEDPEDDPEDDPEEDPDDDPEEDPEEDPEDDPEEDVEDVDPEEELPPQAVSAVAIAAPRSTALSRVDIEAGT